MVSNFFDNNNSKISFYLVKKKSFTIVFKDFFMASKM